MDSARVAIILLSLLFIGAVSIIIVNSDFENNKVLNPQRSDYKIPEWVKSNAKWWSEGHISDTEFSYSMEYLINKDIIKIENCEGECFD